MKPSRLLLILGPFLCVLLCSLYIASLRVDIPHAWTSGDRLMFAQLAPNETVVVSKFFSHGETFGREYRFRRIGQRTEVTAFDADITWEGSEAKLAPARVLATHDLTKQEAKGLDETVAYFREVREEHSSAQKHFRLAYFRDGTKIGEEFYVGFSLPGDLAFLAQEAAAGRTDLALDSARLAREYGVTEERMSRMLPFEMLEKEEMPPTFQPTDPAWRDLP